ncbi:hypothetical protein J3E69DRAFT_352353 [Trichoderma sp. SZMC 28015]
MSTISEAIIKDHRELEEYYNEVVNNPGNHDHQDRYGNQFTWELARHSVEILGEKGKAMAEEDRKEHAVLQKLWGPLSEHIKEEEERDLPTLEEKLQTVEGESASMATSFGWTKAFVPTRSHPSAGEHPPFETAMGLLAAPIDHVADLFRKFPNKKVSPNPSTE